MTLEKFLQKNREVSQKRASLFFFRGLIKNIFKKFLFEILRLQNQIFFLIISKSFEPLSAPVNFEIAASIPFSLIKF